MLNNFKNMIQDVQKEFLWQVTKSKNATKSCEFKDKSIGVIQTEKKSESYHQSSSLSYSCRRYRTISSSLIYVFGIPEGEWVRINIWELPKVIKDNNP